MSESRAQNTARRRRFRSGFTMLEVVVTLMIVGLVSTLSAGRIHSLIVQQRVARAATSLQGDLESAFTIASRNRQPVRIVWNSAKMQMALTDRTGAIFYRRTPLGQDAYGLKSSGVSFSRSPVEVFPNGLADGTLTITITSETSTRTILMSRAGMVRIQ